MEVEFLWDEDGFSSLPVEVVLCPQNSASQTQFCTSDLSVRLHSGSPACSRDESAERSSLPTSHQTTQNSSISSPARLAVFQSLGGKRWPCRRDQNKQDIWWWVILSVLYWGFKNPFHHGVTSTSLPFFNSLMEPFGLLGMALASRCVGFFPSRIPFGMLTSLSRRSPLMSFPFCKRWTGFGWSDTWSTLLQARKAGTLAFVPSSQSISLAVSSHS